MRTVTILPVLSDSVFGICFDPAGERLAACCRDGSVVVWSVPDGVERLSVRVSAPAQALRFAPDGRTLAVAGDDGVSAFDVATGVVVNRWSCPEPQCLAYAPDGRVLLAGTLRGHVLQCEDRVPQVTASVPSPGRPVLSVRFAPGGRLVVAGTADNAALYSWADRTAGWAGLGGCQVNDALFLADEKTCVAALLVRKAGRLGAAEPRHDPEIRLAPVPLGYDPDLYEIAIWAPLSGEQPDGGATLVGHAGWISALDTSPDGTLLASSSFDTTVKVWDLEFRTQVDGCRDHGGAVYGVQFDPSGTYLATCSADRTVRLWDASSIARQRPSIWREPPPLTVEQLLERVQRPAQPGVDHQVIAALDTVDALLPLRSYKDIEDTYRRLYPAWLCGQVPALNRAGRASMLVMNIRREQARREHDEELQGQCERILDALEQWVSDDIVGATVRKGDRGEPAIDVTVTIDDGRLGSELGDLAGTYRDAGRLGAAESAYREAIARAERAHDVAAMVSNLAHLADVYVDLGNRERERETLYQARALGTAAGLGEEMIRVLSRLAALLRRSGDPSGAMRYLEEARALMAGSPDRRTDADLALSMAQCLVSLGEGDAAKERFAQVAEAADHLGDRGLLTASMAGLAELAFGAGDLDEATSLQRRAADLAQGAPARLLSVLPDLAFYRLRAGAAEEAAELLRAAAREGEKLRAEVRLPGEAAGLQDTLANIYARLAHLDLDAGRNEEAFADAEKGRAVLLTRRLADRRLSNADAGDGGPGDDEILGGQPLDAPGVLAALGTRAVLISWMVTNGQVTTFVLRGDERTVHAERVDFADGELETIRADFTRELVRHADLGDIGESWLRLGRLTIDPVLRHLREGDTLILAPHGPLHGLPLHALPAEGPRVIERWPVQYLPSASALPHLVRGGQPPHRFAVLGSHFTAEARDVANVLATSRVLIGVSVEKRAALDLLADADVIHVSAHGYFLASDPDLSGLVIHPSPELDEYVRSRIKGAAAISTGEQEKLLRMEDTARTAVISAEDLHGIALDARLVTLSSCESGLVSVDTADDPSGLVPALLERGARGVFATLWRVDPDTTQAFMVDCYRRFTADGWRSPADAIRQATLTLMGERPHPFYWAPFVLIGSC